MACETPSTTSDCTNVSPCASGGGCGCDETSATPILPKCQDTSLVAGTFKNATIVVSAQGCITSITEGLPEQYTPDECCGGGAQVASTLSIEQQLAALRAEFEAYVAAHP